MIRILAAALPCFVLSLTLCLSQAKFYNFYNNGLEHIEKKDWQRAIMEFRSAASLEFEDTDMKRTYGTHFIEYFPHREMGIAYYQLNEFENARKELDLSIAYVASDRAREYLDLAVRKVPAAAAEEAKMAAEREAEREKTESVEPPPAETSSEHVLPPGALTYDPLRVVQVGERLTLGILRFEGTDEAQKFLDPATDKMIAQLVNLRRFTVIERAVLEKVLKEQQLQVSGLVDEKTAVSVGKIVGADAIILGNISAIGSATTVSARVIDTQSSEVLVAKSEHGGRTDLNEVENLVGSIAISIYNELPLVEGYVVKKEGKTMFVDIGSDKRIRKGSRCVAFREVGDLYHPKTGQFLQKEVVRLGELQVDQVLEKVSRVEVVDEEPGRDIQVGDKVVIK